MGFLTGGGFATALLSILLIYFSIISLEATEKDVSSNEVKMASFILVYVLLQVKTGTLGSNLHHQYELDEAQQKIKLLESKLSMLESRMPQVKGFCQIREYKCIISVLFYPDKQLSRDQVPDVQG